jgi:hypothetical protein
MTTTSKPSAKSSTVLIALGYDDQNPRGARFVAADPDLVRKAAAAMDLEVYEVAPSSELAAVAKDLPVGKVHGKGNGFVPVIEPDLYSEVLCALAPTNGPTDDQANPPLAQGLPRTWDEIAPGHLVVAQEPPEYGWWEAVVIARDGDKVTLRYRDYPGLPKFVRHRSAIALMSPPTS